MTVLRPLALSIAFMLLGGCVNMFTRMVAQKGADAYNRHDLEALLKPYDADAVMVADGQRIVGRDAIREYFRAFFAQFPEVRIELVDITSSGLASPMRVVGHWRMTAAGRAVPVEQVTMARKVGGTTYLIYEATWTGGVNLVAWEIARKTVDAFNRHDVPALTSSYAADAVLTTSDGQRIEGATAIDRAFFAALPDAHTELLDASASAVEGGFRVVVGSRLTAGGRTVRFDLVTLAEWQGDRYRMKQATWNTAEKLWAGLPQVTPPPEPAAPAPTVPLPQQVREHHERAKRAFDVGHLDEAIREWETAYALDARPRLLYNLGTAYQRRGEFNDRAGDLKMARHLLERYAAEAKDVDVSEQLKQIDDQLRRLEH